MWVKETEQSMDQIPRRSYSFFYVALIFFPMFLSLRCECTIVLVYVYYFNFFL